MIPVYRVITSGPGTALVLSAAMLNGALVLRCQAALAFVFAALTPSHARIFFTVGTTTQHIDVSGDFSSPLVLPPVDTTDAAIAAAAAQGTWPNLVAP